MAGEPHRPDQLESLRALASDSGSLDARRHADRRVAMMLSALPLAFLIVLAIVNANYLRSFFDAGPFCGSASIGLVLVLVVISYAAVRGSLSVVRSGRPFLGILLVALSVGLLVLPAILVLLLTPAAIQLMQTYGGRVR